MFDAPPGSVGLVLNLLAEKRAFQIFNEVDEAAFHRAVTDFNEMVDVEQKFDILLYNFLEFEQELATRALRHTYRSDFSPREMMDDKQAFNRRLINVLTAARLYSDQTKHHIKVFFPDDPDAAKGLNALFSKEYDEWLAYRVMEALRNYAQHRGLPLQGFSHSGRWLDNKSPDKLMESNVALNLDTTHLAEDSGFKASVLTELKAFGETIDIKLMVREYVECFGRVHTAFRAKVADRLAEDRAELERSVAEFKAIEPKFERTEGLVLARIKDNGSDYDIIDYYPTHTLIYLENLQARSRTLVNLSRRFVTTAPISSKT